MNLSVDCLIDDELTLTWLVYWNRTARSVFTGAGLKWPNTAGQYSTDYCTLLTICIARTIALHQQKAHFTLCFTRSVVHCSIIWSFNAQNAASLSCNIFQWIENGNAAAKSFFVSIDAWREKWESTCSVPCVAEHRVTFNNTLLSLRITHGTWKFPKLGGGDFERRKNTISIAAGRKNSQWGL